MNPERRRLALGLLLSLLFHALLLSLTFGGQGLGLLGSTFPWPDRRDDLPDLHAALLAPSGPAPAAEPLSGKKADPPADADPAVLTLVDPAPPPQTPLAETMPKAKPKKVAKSKPVAAGPARTAPPAPAPLPAAQFKDSVPPLASLEELATVARSDESTWTVPPASEAPAPVPAVAPSEPNPETAMPRSQETPDARQDAQQQAIQADAERREASRQEAAQQETTRQETARLEAARAEAERAQAERQEAARLEVTRQAAVRAEAARLEAARADAERREITKQAEARLVAQRQEAARQEAARTEAARQDAAKAEASRQDAARSEAARAEAARAADARAEAARVEGERQAAAQQDAARQEGARQDAARQQAALIESARLAAIQAEAEKREERLRAIGRQLNEEADRREAATAGQRLPPSASSLRRGRLFGRTDANAELVAYAETWGRKIQLNMTFDMVREAAKQPHTQPMVTVAIRSDGSVESVAFVRSSGVAAIDDAIRRVIRSQANYPAFSPELLRDFDVVEIRRTWHFDMAIRLD